MFEKMLPVLRNKLLDEVHIKVSENEGVYNVKLHEKNKNVHKIIKNGKTLSIKKIVNESGFNIQITNLDLSDCKLTNLPEDFDFINLHSLNLSHNNFETIPNCLQTGCRSLQHLNLSHNQLNHFDNEPKCGKRLQILLLNNNQLINIPPWILLVKAINLQELYYSYNKVTNLNQSRFKCTSMHMLKKLELRNCFLRDEDVNFVNSIFSLQSLDLSNKSIDNTNVLDVEILLNQPAWLYGIQHLNLSSLGISVLPQSISNLIHLKELHLSDNGLNWLPNEISQLQSLRILNCECNQLIELPSIVKDLKQLEIIRLSHNLLSILPDLHEIKSLKYLDLYNNNIETISIELFDVVDAIDLERNHLETSHLLHYVKKRAKIRQVIEEERINGIKMKQVPSSPAYSLDSYDYENESDFSEKENRVDRIENVNFPAEEEMWDSVYKQDGNLTDDDWIGFELKPVKRSKRTEIVASSQVFELYCDVE